MSKPEPFLATIKEEDADENAEKRGVDVSNNYTYDNAVAMLEKYLSTSVTFLPTHSLMDAAYPRAGCIYPMHDNTVHPGLYDFLEMAGFISRLSGEMYKQAACIAVICFMSRSTDTFYP